MKQLKLLAILCLFLHSACTDKKEQQRVSGKIPAGEFEVYFEQSGEGNPVLLLHAGLQNHSMWDEQVDALSKKFRVVTIDMPFHGNTTGFDTITLAADVVRIVLDSLQIERASVAGLSMGAAVAQDFIIAYPERVSYGILISAGLNGYEKKQPVDSVSMTWYPKFSAALEAKDTALAALEFTKAWGEGVDQKGDSLTKPASQYVYETTIATLKQHKMVSWPKLQKEPLAVDAIAQIRTPILLIHGDKDLPFVATCNDYMEKNMRSVQRVLLNNVAHMLNMEKPAEVNRLMIEFLEKNIRK